MATALAQTHPATRSASIAKLSPLHHEIMRFICAHPTIRRREVAKRFNVTEAWLSTIVNSDCFQDELRRNQIEATSDLFMSISERLEAVAIKGIERMDDLLDVEPDLDIVRKTTDSALKALGYSQPAPTPGVGFQTNNFYVVDRTMLNRAQSRIGRVIEQPPEELNEPNEVGPTSQLPPGDAGDRSPNNVSDASPCSEVPEEAGPAGSGGSIREESPGSFLDEVWG